MPPAASGPMMYSGAGAQAPGMPPAASGPMMYPGAGPSAYGYAGAPFMPAAPAPVVPTPRTYFDSVDMTRKGLLTAEELARALVMGGWQQFSVDLCRMLIKLFDAHGVRAVGPAEFEMLWKFLQDWKRSFDAFDRDHSGSIEVRELQEALGASGMRFTPQFYTVIAFAFNRSHTGHFNFDEFIQLNCEIQMLSGQFRQLDLDQDGVIAVNLEQFLTAIFTCKAFE